MTKKEITEKIAAEMADTMFVALFQEKEMLNFPLADNFRTRVVGMVDAAKALGIKPNVLSGQAANIYNEKYKPREASLKPRMEVK